MTDLRELYQEVILDHGKNPRNHRFPEPSTHRGKGYNPLCGDRIALRMRIEDGVIKDIGFRGEGCAISQASSSTMTEALKGKTVAHAEQMFSEFHALVTAESEPNLDVLGKLAVFAGVGEFPMRVKCATLAWHTLRQALANSDTAAATE